MAVIGNMVFLISWLFYAIFWNSTGTVFVYPVILLPVCAYTFMLVAAVSVSSLTGIKFKAAFTRASPLLVIFALLTLSPLALKLNIPDPHNFVRRKLELALGGAYSIFIAALAVWFFAVLSKFGVIKNAGEKKVFSVIAVFFFAFYFALSLWMNYANEPAGDEPIYLLVAHSMTHDRDLDLKNNYENKDYSRYYSRDLASQELEKDGKLYSYHPVLISAVIAPFYALAGRTGATTAANIIAALSAALLFLLLLKTGVKNGDAFFTAVIAGFFMPALTFSNQLCADVLSGALALSGFLIILYYPKKLLTGAFIAALLPWAHLRNLAIWGVLGAIVCLELAGTFKNKEKVKKEENLTVTGFIIFAFTQAVSFGLLAWFNIAHYGAVIPRQTHADLKASETFALSIKGLLGLMFDQEFGAFIYVPLLALLFAGAVFLYRKNKQLFLYSFAVFVPYYVMIASWLDWRGGGGSFPRLLLPVLFIAYIWTAQLLPKYKKIVVYLSYAGLLMSLIAAVLPWFRWNKGFGLNWTLFMAEKFTHLKFTALFPSLWTGDSFINTAALVFWITAVAAANAYLLMKRSS